MSSGRRSVSRRRRRRLRRLIIGVIVLDGIGAAAVVYALTASGSSPPGGSARQTAAAAAAAGGYSITYPDGRTVAGASDPPPASTTDTTTTTLSAPAVVRPVKHRRRPRRHSPRPAPGSVTLTSPQTSGSFAQFSATQPGQVGVAIAPLGDGPVQTFGALQAGHAWSTMKVPVLTTLLSGLERSGGQLSSSEGQDATLALQQSDNEAAQALFNVLESTDGGLTGASVAVQDALRGAGDASTDINTQANAGGFTTWGQSLWSAAGEVAFYRALARGCLLSAPDTQYVLGLMSEVTPSQRWGAGSAGLPAPLMFKGGWGPENGGGYLVRQTAIVGSGDRGWVFSMLALPSDGAFGTGTQMLSAAASWVARAFPAQATFPPASC